MCTLFAGDDRHLTYSNGAVQIQVGGFGARWDSKLLRRSIFSTEGATLEK